MCELPNSAKPAQRLEALLVLALLFAGPLHAQDLAPELLPLATKYRADASTLETQKTAEMARAAQFYSSALDAAERAETTAGHVAAIAAITHERDALKKSEVEAEFPKDLPKGLQTARKTYLDAVARVVVDFGQRKERINADYLRNLATLQTRIGNNPTIAAQITAEKEKLLAGAGNSPSPATTPHEFVGTWTLTATTGYSGTRTLKADGTVVVDNQIWKWKVENNQLKVEQNEGNGAWDHFDLPFHEGKITGKNQNGVDLTLSKRKPR